MNGFFNIDSPIMRLLSKVCDLMILNALCIICCLPIVTAGASVTALYTITMKMVRGEESYIFKGFFKAFKENFKQSTIIWLIMAVLGIFILVDYRATAILPQNISNLFRVLIGALIIFYAMILSYVFPYPVCQYYQKYFQEFSPDCDFKSAMDYFDCCYPGSSWFPYSSDHKNSCIWKYVMDSFWIFCRCIYRIYHVPQNFCKI